MKRKAARGQGWDFKLKAPGPARRPWPRLGFLARLLLFLVILPPLLVLLYRFAPPPIDILMIQRSFEGHGIDKSWRPLDRISPDLARAVIAAEDARFCQHRGFDLKAMEAAAAHNEEGGRRLRGGSTIDQQTAKNVFLWPGRDYVRKGLEAAFTVLEEILWGKRRILEIYLNVVEWGPGVYGAEAAARHYFHHDADDLSPEEAARLAAILPSPLKWRPVHPGRYVRRRSARIDKGAETVRAEDLGGCAGV